MSLSERTDLTVDQPTSAPTNKVLAGGIGSAIAVILAFAFQAVTGNELPVGVEGAVATLVYALIGYFVPNTAFQL